MAGGNAAPVIRVIHEATEVLPVKAEDFRRLPREDQRKYALNPRTTFYAGIPALFDARDGAKAPFLLLGRHPFAQPLLIDVDTLTVRVLDLPLFIHSLNCFGAEGAIFTVNTDHRGMLAALDLAANDPAQRYRYMPLANPQKIFAPYKANLNGTEAQYYASLSASNCLAADDGWIYFPGETWHRFHPKTLTVQCLVRERLPSAYSRSMHYSYSTLLSMRVWYDRTWYRVTVDDTKIPETQL